jgi:replicative DNA helicase
MYMPDSKQKSTTLSTTQLATPPNDLEAEKAILGSILLNPNILDDIVSILKPEFFYDPRHTAVYEVMTKLVAQQKPIDILFVSDALKGSNAAIDKDFLLELISKSSMASSPAQTCKIIKEKHALRTIIQVGDQLKSSALRDDTQPNDILDSAQKTLFNLSLENIEKNFVPISEVLDETFERIQTLSESDDEHRGIPTGFYDLDKVLGGLHPSDLIILAARPSMGKTAFALEISRRVAMQSNKGVAFFSLEMSKDQLVDRILATVSKIDFWKIRTGKFSHDPGNDEFSQLGEALGKLSEAPIWIDDSGSLNILELRSKARRLKYRHDIGLIVIDYLQLMSGRSDTKYSGNRVQEVSDISRGLKLLAKELNVPVLALSQLSRSVEGRDDKRPMLSDLRESGSIEQDADIVIFVHREEMYHKETKKKGIADILISKHRNGEVGSIELSFIHRFATFDNLEGAHLSRRVNQ